MVRLRLVSVQIKEIEQERLRKLAAGAPAQKAPQAMIRLIARVLGIGIETADMLVNEILSRHLRDSKAVARYAGLTGSPDESGRRRREKGLARAGNARVRRGMIQPCLYGCLTNAAVGGILSTMDTIFPTSLLIIIASANNYLKISFANQPRPRFRLLISG